MNGTKLQSAPFSAIISAAALFTAFVAILASCVTDSPASAFERPGVDAMARDPADERLSDDLAGGKGGAPPESEPLSASAVYDPVIGLKPQIERLETLADRGNPYANCVLAAAFALCAEHRNRTRFDGLDADAVGRADEGTIEALYARIRSREEADRLCLGITQDDMSKSRARLFESAKLGNAVSMTKFASSLQERMDNEDAPSDEIRQFYLENAESMLNRAASAGDPEAILAVHHAYSTGAMQSEYGRLEFEVDMAKALAAARTLTLYGTSETKAGLAPFIASAERVLDPNRRAEVSALESTYRRNYWKRRAGQSIHARYPDDLPESVCKHSG